jgi:hypothetical protein
MIQAAAIKTNKLKQNVIKEFVHNGSKYKHVLDTTTDDVLLIDIEGEVVAIYSADGTMIVNGESIGTFALDRNNVWVFSYEFIDNKLTSDQNNRSLPLIDFEILVSKSYLEGMHGNI